MENTTAFSTPIDRPHLPESPSVGFFWFVREAGAWRLLGDRLTLAEAEDYGDCLTHPSGHADLWADLAARGAPGLKAGGFPTLIAASEYEDHPRGRVVYDRRAARFTVYVDPRITGPAFRACLEASFGLGAEPRQFRLDAHYQPSPAF